MTLVSLPEVTGVVNAPWVGVGSSEQRKRRAERRGYSSSITNVEIKECYLRKTSILSVRKRGQESKRRFGWLSVGKGSTGSFASQFPLTLLSPYPHYN
jgi:hypothetical protein